jgi:hypothetical protein
VGELSRWLQRSEPLGTVVTVPQAEISSGCFRKAGLRWRELGVEIPQIHVGHAAHALVALRNAILNLFRQRGWTNVADAFRYYAASVQDCLDLTGAVPN